MNDFYALLIGIDCYLPNQLPDGASYRSLNGCVRDITDVEAFLKRQFNLPSERIYKLTASNVDGSSEPSESPEQWPTYENIVGKFKELTERAQPQDQVYIHYSGHGGRAVTNSLELKGTKGIDEALVPTNIGNPKARYLRDFELAALLQTMVDKGLVVTVVLDSCHSGGTTRAGDSAIRGADRETVDTTPRPTESLVASAADLAKTWQDLAQETTRSGKSNISFLPGAKGYVMLAACRPSELANEYPFNGKENNGALTYWLLDSLKNYSPDLTYRVIYDRINAKVHSKFSSQTPMLFGEGNRLVFGSDSASLQYAVTVMQVDAATNLVRVQLNAGQAQGLSEGAQLAIYPPGTTDFTQEEKQLAIAEITEIGATDAWAQIVKTIRAGEIEQAAQAVLLSAPVEVVRKVRLVYQPESQLPPGIEQNAALQAIETALAGNGWVKLVSENEAADYQVAINTAGEYKIWDASGTPIANLRPPLKVGERNAATGVVKRLVHLTKYKATEELDNFTPLTNKLVVELAGKQTNYKPGRRPTPEPFDDPMNPTVKAGEWIFLRIRNNYSQVLNVTLLNLQSDWAIDQLELLNEGARFEPFDPEQEELIPIKMLDVLEGYNEVTDIYKVFATVGQPDFRWLELPPLDQPIPKSATRGLKVPSNLLEELLATIGADNQPRETTKAGRVYADPSRGWTTKQVTVKVTAS
ncbi:caspase family protein [Lyngbya aestuarii]|uniref:caspase family protein n=1 Tax=Lyngbya aestuarii TaxID=118322 RepID=UPI00403DB021